LSDDGTNFIDDTCLRLQICSIWHTPRSASLSLPSSPPPPPAAAAAATTAGMNGRTTARPYVRSIDIVSRVDWNSNSQVTSTDKQCTFPCGHAVYSQLSQRHGIYCFCGQLRRVTPNNTSPSYTACSHSEMKRTVGVFAMRTEFAIILSGLIIIFTFRRLEVRFSGNALVSFNV